ncbi:MAG: 3',5'-cyclic-nucleotide phosphodiesterase [Methylotenera sp.]|nr:3',5'-cyclic-nucleotide phosphodiesterase [Methylotenera sp.]
MQIKILGCSGGIGGSQRTTSILVDSDILIDAGTGVSDLSMDALMAIDHIFITHAHLDHIACIPLLLDTVMGFRNQPVTVHATPETLQTLRTHIFNWKIWPDFNVIPNQEAPMLRYSALTLGEAVTLGDRKITPLPAHHVIDAVGYQIQSPEASLVFTGDTTTCDALWHKINTIEHLKYLIIETAFSNAELALAKLSKHLCPSMLIDELAKFKPKTQGNPTEIFITHLKPGEGQMIMQEIENSVWIQQNKMSIKALKQSQVFDL